MTVLVTYMSLTGNTEKVAEAIYGGILGEKMMRPMDQVNSLDDYDLAFIGFPIYSMNVPAQAKMFMDKHAKGRRVAVFYTHASYYDPEMMPQSKDLVKAIQKNVQDAIAGMDVVGSFDCRGELSEPVAQKCLGSSDATVQMFGKLRSMTVGHPDAAELTAAKAFAEEIMAQK